MRKPVFTSVGWSEFLEWSKDDVKILKKILELIDDAVRTPFTGLGKPEALKHNLKGYCGAARAVKAYKS